MGNVKSGDNFSSLVRKRGRVARYCPVTRHPSNGQPPGAVIRRLREERGWTQRELAERVGHIDAAGVSKIETGVTKLGKTRALRFARALDTQISQLLQPADPAPTLREIHGLLEEVATEVGDLIGNQERLAKTVESLISAVEHLASPEGQAGEHGSTGRPQVGGPLSPSE